MSDIAAAIAAAVEQQGAATREIARNVQQAAQGTASVAADIESVNQAARGNATKADSALAKVGELSGQSETLRLHVDHFLATVRAG